MADDNKIGPGMAYNMKKLNKLFAFLSFALLVTVGWVFLTDYLRPWKLWQIKSLKVKRAKLTNDLEKIKQGEGMNRFLTYGERLKDAKRIKANNPEKIAKLKDNLKNAKDKEAVETQIKTLEDQLKVSMEEIPMLEQKDPNLSEYDEKELKEANAIIAAKSDEIEKAEEELRRIDALIKDETIVNGQTNAFAAESTFNYELAQGEADHHPEDLGHKLHAEALLKKLRADKKLFSESKERLKAHQAKYKAQRKVVGKLKKELTDAEKRKKKALATKSLIELAIQKTDSIVESTSPKQTGIWLLRNAPIIDWMDPSLRITQVVVNDVTDDRYFQKVPKVDRCTTCHTFIGTPGYEDQENPFKTHPKMDLMVGLDSPHPIKKFGCTSCHGGEGHRVNDFQSIAHTPNDKEQEAEWVEKYNWHAPHKVVQPMYPMRHIESSCVKCHEGVEFIPRGTTVNKGRRLIEKYGCYSCHKIKGWEHKRSSGPSLEKIASKVSKEFIKNWVWEPKRFNKHAMMPSFFRQSNNIKKEFQEKNVAEVNAMAEFLVHKSKKYDPFMKYTGGDVGKGKELIKAVGCMGCHGVEGFDKLSRKMDNYAGPYLTGTGSKVNPDWLVSWLKKPDHYQEDTIMPSFRLTDKEANDIAAYLLSLKNKQFEDLKFDPLNKKVRDELLLEYLMAFDTQDVAQAKLDKMTDRERTLELGDRSIGKYGCYSCHSIDGFKGRAPIGPDLSAFGSKPLSQIGFGQYHHSMDHTREAWIEAHLINPRKWDKGKDAPFKDLTRMPNFYLTKEESQAISTAILGYVADEVPLKGQKRLDAQEKQAAEGFKLVNKYNCIGCHKINGEYGSILAAYEDDLNAGPPWLVNQGHRVQTEWFHKFLKEVHPIRPWLEVRMPSYKLTNEERNKIVTYFQADAKEKTFEDTADVVKWLPGERENAKKLFEALECASCHTQGFNDEEAQAPNLYVVKQRLRPSWVKKWLENPQAILPHTSMPNFWEDGEATEENIFGGDMKKQIDALTKYLYEIGHDKYPKPFPLGKGPSPKKEKEGSLVARRNNN